MLVLLIRTGGIPMLLDYFTKTISDLSKHLKDERRGHTNHHELAHQSESKRSKRFKARQMCVDTNAI